MILSDKELKNRIVQGPPLNIETAKEQWRNGEWDKIANKILIDPFTTRALGPCCYDLSVGDEYISLRDPENTQPLKEGQHINIGPGETVLILTREYICLPRNILAMLVPRARWLFEGGSLSATRVDPTWYGKLLVGFTNSAKNPLTLEYGEAFCTTYFMEATETEKVLTIDTSPALGRAKIGTVRFAHAKPQRLKAPEKVTLDDIEKVAELYGWPWDVVRGILHLTRKEIGEWIEKEVSADIVNEATTAAVKTAFDKLLEQSTEQNKWNRNLTITIIIVLGTIGAAILGAAATYIITKFI